MDNETDVNWKGAFDYCENLTLAGYSDWRLPNIEELAKLYDPKSGDIYWIRNPFELTSWFVWSSNKEGSDSAWYFNFYPGERIHDHPVSQRVPRDLADSSLVRALCVRGPGE
jgi:hypothetical protein